MPDFLSIPGNIRQQYMPFTISGPGKRQVFSFKDVVKKGYPNARQIHPFSKWAETLIANDSGVQYTHGPKGGSDKVKFDEFLDEIPALQIREYVPDAKLTQTFKWFSYFKKGFDAGLQNIDSKAFSFTGLKEEVAKIMDSIGEKMKNLTSGSAPLLADVVGGLAHFYQDKGYNIGEDNGFAVLFLPFIMYYRLTTTHTNNVYEIPYSMQNEIMKSDGTYGWSGGNQSDFGLIDKAIGAAGESPITKLLLGNTVKVNMMPSFQPTGEARGESFTINIDLINDSDEAAINNFLMCHTLFGNNRWLQYGFVQAGASLYDVKLPGANRYFMCSGAFSCKGKGAFRTPSAKVCEAIKNCAHPEKTFAGEMGNITLSNGTSIRDAMVNAKAQQKTDAQINAGDYGEVSSDTISALKFRKALRLKRSPRDDSYMGDGPTPEELDAWRYEQTTKQIAAGIETGATAGMSQSSIPSTNDKAARTTYQSISKEQAAAANKNGILFSQQVREYEAANAAFTTAEQNVGNAIDNVSNAQNGVSEAQLAFNEAKAAYEKMPSQENQEKMNAAADDLAAATTNLDNAKTELDSARIILKDKETEMDEKRAPIETALNVRNRAPATAEVDAYAAASTVTPEDIKKLIKIPDVYSLTLTFNSLLPDNFNNYLYGFRAGNLDPIENYAKGTVDETGVFEKLVQQLEDALKKG